MTARSNALHICPLCEAGCGLDVTVEGDRVALVRGDRDDVFSCGYLCPKGTALKDLQDDPDRLRRPLVKRNGTFVEVSFDEAFDEVERRLLPILDAHGPLAGGLVIGNPSVHRTGIVLALTDLAESLGSPNVFSAASLDQMPKHLAVGLMFGDHYSIGVPDIDRTDLLVVIGANPMVSNGSMWSVPDFRGRARALRARGGRLITIDPRRTETADLSDEHLPVRPGADVFLLAAVVNTIFADGSVDLGRLDPFVSGVDEVRAAVAGFTPESVAARCGLRADQIRGLARQISSAPSAAVYGRLGTCFQDHATVVSWLIDVINVVTGNLDRPGGVMFPCAPAFASNTAGAPGSGAGVTTGRYHSRVSGAPEVMGQLPLACLAEEITTPGDGRIRALITIASNVALSGPNSRGISAALSALEFMVSLDVYLNETTRHADVIIPGPSPLEEGHYDVFFSQFAHRNVARYSPAALAAPAGTPSDWETMLRLIAILERRGADVDLDSYDDERLADRLRASAGDAAPSILAALAPRRGPERLIDLSLRTGPYGDLFGGRPGGLGLDAVLAAPSGIDLGELTERIPEMLRTPSGTVELAPSEIVADLAIAAAGLPAAGPCGEPVSSDGHDAAASDRAVVIGRRHLRSNNSWMHNLPVLAKGRDRCTLLVHPDDAARWHLDHGCSATVTSCATGAAIDATVEITDEMSVGVVSLPHGWGHDQPDARLGVATRRPGVGLNVLADAARRDRLSGNAVLGGYEVTVHRTPVAG